MPPNPFKIHSVIKSNYLSDSPEKYSFVLPSTSLLFSNEYGHPRLHNGRLNIVVSLSPLVSIPKINSSTILIAQTNVKWKLKPSKYLAPCVYFTNRKQSSITGVMSIFLAIATIAGCIIGIFLKIIYDRCLDAREEVRKLHSHIPVDPIARAARQAKDRAEKGISSIQILDIESLPNFNEEDYDENDGVGYVHDNENPQSWRNFFDKKTEYSKLK